MLTIVLFVPCMALVNQPTILQQISCLLAIKFSCLHKYFDHADLFIHFVLSASRSLVLFTCDKSIQNMHPLFLTVLSKMLFAVH
jgi:hypothetical protein